MTDLSNMKTYVDADYIAEEIQRLKQEADDDTSFIIACNSIYEILHRAPHVVIDIRDDYRGRV